MVGRCRMRGLGAAPKCDRACKKTNQLNGQMQYRAYEDRPANCDENQITGRNAPAALSAMFSGRIFASILLLPEC